MPWVMDCSIAAALGLPDELSDTAEAFFPILSRDDVWVPSLWWHEIGNVLIAARGRERITDNDASALMQLYGALPLHTDTAYGPSLMERVHRLATCHGLSAYDAAYLELAERRQAGLATLDAGLRKAASDCGVPIFS